MLHTSLYVPYIYLPTFIIICNIIIFYIVYKLSLNKGFARHSTVSVGDLTPAEKIKMEPAVYRGVGHLNLVII